LLPQRLHASLARHMTDTNQLLDEFATLVRARTGPMVLGLCGSQGSGKSTLARRISRYLSDREGCSVAVLSLDDLYLASERRAQLAREVHSLLRTRGVPGTHDVALGVSTIRKLLSALPNDSTRIPRFDKSRDEPYPMEQWEELTGAVDVVLFEGWCVGALPQDESALASPVNELEREEDRDGRWRHYVNDQLRGCYRELFGLIDRLAMLQAPAFEVVFDWRRQQERELEASVRSGVADQPAAKIMDDADLRRFIMHYERLTRHILGEMPARADLVAQLGRERQIRAICKR
jgi:D-glycerate 3-kinase